MQVLMTTPRGDNVVLCHYHHYYVFILGLSIRGHKKLYTVYFHIETNHAQIPSDVRVYLTLVHFQFQNYQQLLKHLMVVKHCQLTINVISKDQHRTLLETLLHMPCTFVKVYQINLLSAIMRYLF